MTDKKEKGYVQVYTGNGKGKTTAAIGLAMRAICAGKKVFMGQFIKGMAYSEQKLPDLVPNFTMELWGRDCFIDGPPSEEDLAEAKKGLEKAKKVINSGEYDVVILDEINVATYFKLFTAEDILELIDNKPDYVELILTGRYCPYEVINRADLVTEMVEINHYYHKGVQARKGIEN